MFFVAVSQLVGAEAGGAQALGPTPGAWELLSPGTAVQLWGSKTSDLPQAGIGGTGGKCFQALLLGGRRGTLLPMPLPGHVPLLPAGALLVPRAPLLAP